jgi:TPR repeat protein
MYKKFNSCLIHFISFAILMLIIPYAYSSPSDKNSYELLQKAADRGDAKAQNSLGWCYAIGRGVAQDLSEATEWFKKAAEQGNTRAQSALKRLDEMDTK